MVLGSSEGLGVGYICVKCRYIIEVNLRVCNPCNPYPRACGPKFKMHGRNR